jgi:tetratricopeptide (TPR) repeat protein
MQHAVVPSEKQGRKMALVVGVSMYDYQPSHLFCEKNGLDMYEVLKSEGYEIQDKHKLLGQVNQEIVRKEIIEFFTSSKSEDSIILYYSGQVFLTRQGTVYLGLSNTNPAIPFQGAISFSDLINIIELGCSSRKIIIIIDCIMGSKQKAIDWKEDPNLERANSYIRVKSNIFGKSGKILLACLQNSQEAYALAREGNSIFTYFLISGLQSNEQPKNGFAKITAENVGNFVLEQLRHLPIEKRPSHNPIIMTQSPNDVIIVNQNKESRHESLKFEAVDSLLNDIVETLWVKGNTMCELNKYDEAIECYDKAIELNPNNADAYNNKGTVLSELRNYHQAIECYDKAIALSKNDDIIYYNKGNALCELNKYDEAIEYYDKAIELNPNNADAYNNKAYALFKSLRRKKARESLNRAKNLIR